MNILGIHDGHSASAALIIDGQVEAAVQEERITLAKNQGGFPEKAVEDVLTQADIDISSVDAVAFSGFGLSNVKTRDDIIAAYHRWIEPQHKAPLKELEELFRSIRPQAIKDQRKKKKLDRKMKERSQPLIDRGVPSEKIHFIDHHRCHASASYYGCGNMDDDILVLTCDAAGDHKCATVNIGRKGQLSQVAEVPSTASVTIIYSLITYLMGFVPLEHEYKLMGLAPYTRGSSHVREIADYFHSYFCISPHAPLIWELTGNIEDTFRIGSLLKEFISYKRFDNIAGGLQLFIEEFFSAWVTRVVKELGIRKLALSGGLFMNVKLNKLIMELPGVDSLFVFPSCGDETNSFGAAWCHYHDQAKAQGRHVNVQPMGPLYLGKAFSGKEVEEAISNYNFTKKVKVTALQDMEKQCAELLSQGNVVARFKNRMEFGARALGNRSILANPTSWQAVKTINEMIKMRDFWMPFAPSILSECADEYIINPKQISAPYMTLAFDSKPEKMDKIIAATHPYDETCRPQVVEKEWNPDYHYLISCYKELTGEGVILNTSFNLHGFPIVYTPEEALQVFDNSGLRYLALENQLVEEIAF